MRLAWGDSKHLREESESYQPQLTRRQYAERQCPYHEEGHSAGDRHPRSPSVSDWLFASR